MGLFARAYGLRDFELENNKRARTQLSKAALDRSGTDSDLLDAFLYFKFDLGNIPAEFRIGEQVINWGESTFIQGGANVINHFNVAALRLPGAELREGLLPQDVVWLSLGVTPNAELELVYQFDWDDTEPDPVGTYFSTNDFAVKGGIGSPARIRRYTGFSESAVFHTRTEVSTRFHVGLRAEPTTVVRVAPHSVILRKISITVLSLASTITSTTAACRSSAPVQVRLQGCRSPLQSALTPAPVVHPILPRLPGPTCS